MRHIELKRGGNITIKTPNGKIVIGVSDHYNEPEYTALYFGTVVNKTTSVVTLDELLKAYAEEPR